MQASVGASVAVRVAGVMHLRDVDAYELLGLASGQNYGEKCGAPVAPVLMETMRLTPQIRSSSMRSKDLFDRLLSFFVPT